MNLFGRVLDDEGVDHERVDEGMTDSDNERVRVVLLESNSSGL